MNKQVVVVDYGLGNLLSVRRALEHCGATVVISQDKKIIENAERLFLPGVGAFARGMQALNNSHLIEAILQFAQKGKPLLGVCLGMQMLMDKSHEFGEHEGLGLITGSVERISNINVKGERHPIPHIAWSELICPEPISWENSLLSSVTKKDTVYFLHSFQAIPKDQKHLLAVTNYNNVVLTAAINKDNVMGVQFHPEKSGQVGLAILSAFMKM